MARKCDICGKGPVSGFNKPHSKHKTKRSFLPNLHNKTLKVEGMKTKVKVCTKCLKSL